MHHRLHFKRIVWCRKRSTLWWYHRSQQPRWFPRRLRWPMRQTCHMIMPMARVSIKLPCKPRLQVPVIHRVSLATSTDMPQRPRPRQLGKLPNQHHIQHRRLRHRLLLVMPHLQHQRLCTRHRLDSQKSFRRVLHRRMRRRARHLLPHSCFPGSQGKLIIPRAPPSLRRNRRWTKKACD